MQSAVFVLGEFGTWTYYVEAFAVDIDLKLIFLDTLEFPRQFGK